MMLRCDKCGEVFEYPAKLSDMGGDRGEDLAVCPYCTYEEMTEVKMCEECGEWKDEETVHNGICESCLTEIGYEEDIAWEFGEKYKQKIEINGLYAYLFYDDEIDTLLATAAAKCIANNEHKGYWREDADAYAQFIKERKKK